MKRGLNEVIAITTREEKKKCLSKKNDNHSFCDSSRMYHANRMTEQSDERKKCYVSIETRAKFR